MNRIILIGNGFDLAHDIPTSYNDFLNDFWKNTIKEVQISKGITDFNGKTKFENNDIIINNLPNEWYKDFTYPTFQRNLKYYNSNLIFKNRFLEFITNKSNIQNWVDIENEYYTLLKDSFKINSLPHYKIEKLNEDFNRIKKLLIEYLIKVEKEFINSFNNKKLKTSIGSKIFSQFKYKDFTDKSISKKVHEEYKKIENDLKELYNNNINFEEISFKKQPLIDAIDYNNPIESLRKILISEGARNYFELIPEHTLFLNFNYTETELLYDNPNRFENMNAISTKYTKTEFIHIHGNLKYQKNPIIFGFGDELDEDYKMIEKLNDNEYLENIKSIKYLETDNYKNLLSFVNSQEYQVFIFGHSCGISDRTLLNTLFEHENCVSIKPFYYKKKDSDNYSDIIRNISRNFNDKRIMRDKVVNKMFCEPLS